MNSLLFDQQQEFPLFVRAMLDADVVPSEFESKTHLDVVLEHQLVEGVGECNGCFIRDLLFLGDANDVAGADLDEYLALVLRVAGQHDDELELAVRLVHELF